MKRREFISLLGCGLAAGLPQGVKAQSSKVYRVGLALTTSPLSEMAGPDPDQPSVRAFVHGLRDLGYVEGQNLILERAQPHTCIACALRPPRSIDVGASSRAMR